ncbi:MAG: TolC family protein [Verrucomicrobiaceae bacterium]
MYRIRPHTFIKNTVGILVIFTGLSGAETKGLSLSSVRQLVLERNAAIQGKILGYESKRRLMEGAKGAFDPQFLLSYQHEDSNRPNTVEQRRQLEGVPNLNEQNNLYSSSLQTLTPLGGKAGITFSVSDLKNNLQNLNDPVLGATGQGERVTFLGVTLTQPLLKDAGPNAAKAAIRVAASDSEQAFQEYRRQLMITLSSAELAYWNLYVAQQQVKFFEESLGLTTQMQKDAETEVKAEKSAPLKWTQAKAAVQERNGKLAMAREKLSEATLTLAGYCGLDLTESTVLRATDAPPVAKSDGLDLGPALQCTLKSNPDLLGKQAEAEAESIRTEYARNQNLPRLDLKGAYGLNGLGSSFGSSWDDVSGGSYPAWSVGVEFSIPLGNREGSNRLAAAVARRKIAETTLADTRQQLINGVHTALKRVRIARAGLASYEAAVGLNREILDSGLVELKAGKTELRRVLEAENDLAQSKISALAALVSYHQMVLEYQMATGQTLELRGMEISRNELTKRTAKLVRGKFVSEDEFQKFMREFRDSLSTPGQK